MNAVRDFFRDLTLKPQGVTVVVAAFLPIFAIVSMFPVVATMIEHFSADPDAKAKVPLMVTAPGLTIAILSPFAGYLVDRFGRRRLLLSCTFLYGVFGFAPFFLQDIDAIFVSRLLLGVCEAGILTIVNTLIGDYWDDRGRRNWLFLQGVAGPFFAAGVVLLSGAAAATRWNAVFLVYLVAFPIFLAMLLWLFEPRKSAGHDDPAAPAPVATRFPARPAAGMVALTLLASALYYVFIVNGSMVFREIGIDDPARLARLTAIPSLFVMLGAVIFRALAGRSSALQIAVFLSALGLGLAGMGMARSVEQAIAALVIQQIGAGMAVPTLIAWAQTKFPFEHRGRGMGLWSGAFFFGQFSSPWLVHRLDLSLGSMQGAFIVAGAIGLAAGAVALVLAVRRRSAGPALVQER